jgi:hypothetical protein
MADINGSKKSAPLSTWRCAKPKCFENIDTAAAAMHRLHLNFQEYSLRVWLRLS